MFTRFKVVILGIKRLVEVVYMGICASKKWRKVAKAKVETPIIPVLPPDNMVFVVNLNIAICGNGPCEAITLCAATENDKKPVENIRGVVFARGYRSDRCLVLLR